MQYPVNPVLPWPILVEGWSPDIGSEKRAQAGKGLDQALGRQPTKRFEASTDAGKLPASGA
jgi:hypothetical protein